MGDLRQGERTGDGSRYRASEWGVVERRTHHRVDVTHRPADPDNIPPSVVVGGKGAAVTDLGGTHAGDVERERGGSGEPRISYPSGFPCARASIASTCPYPPPREMARRRAWSGRVRLSMQKAHS